MTNPEIWLAPLHGITNYHLRNTLFNHFGGVDFCISPFIAVQSIRQINRRVWEDVFPENNTSVRLIPQLMGNEPQYFVDTLNFLNDNFGYERFNINLGCPSSKVLRHKRGCSLLTDPERVEKIVELITINTSYRISLKMRLGLRSELESFNILCRMESYPIDFIVLHPRLGVNLYEGDVDYESLNTCLSITNHKLIYSGDIFSKEDFIRISNRFPSVQGWMLGRGLLSNPFLAEEIKQNIKEGDFIDRFEVFYDNYVEVLLSYRTESGALAQLKELWHYFRYFFNLSDTALRNLLRINIFSEFYKLSKEIITRDFCFK